jgi:hypothetical protein
VRSVLNYRKSRIPTMKNLIILLYVSLIMGIIILPMSATAATDTTLNTTQTPSGFRTLQTPVKVAITPTPASRPPSGEVVFPITRHETPTPTIRRTTIPATPTILRTTVSPTPTIPRTTVTATPTISSTTIPVTPTILQISPSATPTVLPTTIPATQTTPVPVVTVTVFVYPSGSVYRPAYYYPAGYPYDSSSYYPPYYPYDVNSYYSSGTLTVTSNPPGATVILDEYNTEITPWVFTGLPTGYHTVEVIYPGYETYTTNVYIDTGASIEVNADLNGQVSYGSMFITSNPPEADVYVDGNYQGSSPVTVGAMSEGSHQVELHLAGYEVLTATEYVSAGQGTVVNLAMVPYSSSSAEGSIDITSNLPGALVYLDGIYKGATQAGTTFNVIAVSPGSHTILLHLPGYTDFTRTVQVNAGQISTTNAEFTVQQSPAPSSPQTGSIIVTSTPTGGQVYVDNQLRGAAPVTIYNVATGTHIINMKLAGYNDWSSSADVPANQVVRVSATLTPGTGSKPILPGIPLSPLIVIGALILGTIVISGRIRR